MSTQDNTQPVKRQKKASQKQKAFVRAYLSNGGNATEAALETYNTEDRNTASVIGSENLTKPSVLALLNDHEEEAEAVIVDIMSNRGEMSRDRIAAAKLLLAYTRGNPVSRNENINVNVTLEDILS